MSGRAGPPPAQRLEQSAESDFATSYFKPPSRLDVLSKYGVESGMRRADGKPRQHPPKADGLLSGVLYTDDLYGQAAQLHQQLGQLGQPRANSALRKPQRLEALQVSRNKSFA